MLVNMIGMPLPDFEQHVKNEVIDNIALEEGKPHDDSHDDFDINDTYDGTDNSQGDRGDDYDDDDMGRSESNRDSSLDDYASPDDMPAYLYAQYDSSDKNEMPLGDSRSFIDSLTDQIAEFDLNEQEQKLMQYLIGSLDSNGFIERDLQAMADDLAIYEGIDVTKHELDRLLKILQQFDPAGIGARNTQECLLIQLARKQDDSGKQLTLEQEIIANHYDDYLHQRTDTLANALGITKYQLSEAIANIKQCNPHPGIALCESTVGQVQTIIPDFIIETTPDGDINFSVNSGEIPELHVSNDYLMQLKQFEQHHDRMSRSERDAFEYTRQKVESARNFIDAIRQRHQTLTLIMKAIIKYQREFILTQDTSTLVPMRLEDISEITNMGISTVSRVQNSKYTQIDGTLYPLSTFFKRKRTNADGEDIEFDKVCDAIHDIISHEDRTNPLSDEKIGQELAGRGFNIQRRTVAKYRDHLCIPTAAKRKDKV